MIRSLRLRLALFAWTAVAGCVPLAVAPPTADERAAGEHRPRVTVPAPDELPPGLPWWAYIVYAPAVSVVSYLLARRVRITMALARQAAQPHIEGPKHPSGRADALWLCALGIVAITTLGLTALAVGIDGVAYGGAVAAIAAIIGGVCGWSTGRERSR